MSFKNELESIDSKIQQDRFDAQERSNRAEMEKQRKINEAERIKIERINLLRQFTDTAYNYVLDEKYAEIYNYLNQSLPNSKKWKAAEVEGTGSYEGFQGDPADPDRVSTTVKYYGYILIGLKEQRPEEEIYSLIFSGIRDYQSYIITNTTATRKRGLFGPKGNINISGGKLAHTTAFNLPSDIDNLRKLNYDLNTNSQSEEIKSFENYANESLLSAFRAIRT